MPNTGKVIKNISEFLNPVIGFYDFVGIQPAPAIDETVIAFSSSSAASITNLSLHSSSDITVTTNARLQASLNQTTVFNFSSNAEALHQVDGMIATDIITLQSIADISFYTSIMPPSNRARGSITTQIYAQPLVVTQINMSGFNASIFELTPTPCTTVQYLYGTAGLSESVITIAGTGDPILDRSSIEVHGDVKAQINIDGITGFYIINNSSYDGTAISRTSITAVVSAVIL